MAKSKETTNVPDNYTKDKIMAVIYGQCIGDAIGLLTEFLTRREAKLYYTPVRVKGLEYHHKLIVSDVHRTRWEVGDWTDDSDQMILIMLSLIDKKGEVDYMDYASKLKRWTEKGFPELGDIGGMGIGKTTATVLNHPSYLLNPHAAADLVWNSSQRYLAPNGAVMRTSILGVHKYWDLDAVYQNSIDVAKTTHADPRCHASVVAVSTAIALMLQDKYKTKFGNVDVKQVIEEAYSRACRCLETDEQKTELLSYLKCKDLKELKLEEAGKIGYTYKSLGCGFWALKQSDFRKAITKITMQGGDADSNACVAGAMLGCKLGSRAIPSSWKNDLRHKEWLNRKIHKYFKTMNWET